MHHECMTNRQMPDAWAVGDRDDGDRTLRVLLAIVLTATIVGGGFDLFLDSPTSWNSPHVVYEVLLLLLALITMVLLWRGWWRSAHTLRQTRHVLAARAAERDAWRASAEAALAGLGRAIDERFAAWRLTPVEREVALFLLKGHSHKQIAYTTGRSERTIRQHAVSVYEKSGLSGRAELAAFFLEGVLLPQHADVTGT
jgi:DNA-binding CsgD family transcriptional regulator